jgi:hypothetical protein
MGIGADKTEHRLRSSPNAAMRSLICRSNRRAIAGSSQRAARTRGKGRSERDFVNVAERMILSASVESDSSLRSVRASRFLTRTSAKVVHPKRIGNAIAIELILPEGVELRIVVLGNVFLADGEAGVRFGKRLSDGFFGHM